VDPRTGIGPVAFGLEDQSLQDQQTRDCWCGTLESNQLARASGLQPDSRPLGESHIVWSPSKDLHPVLLITKQAHRYVCFKGIIGADRGNQTLAVRVEAFRKSLHTCVTLVEYVRIELTLQSPCKGNQLAPEQTPCWQKEEESNSKRCRSSQVATDCRSNLRHLLLLVALVGVEPTDLRF
jgi:hypothetical protein